MSWTNTPMLPQPLAAELLAAPLIANLATFNEDATIRSESAASWDETETDAARDLRGSGELISPVLRWGMAHVYRLTPIRRLAIEKLAPTRRNEASRGVGKSGRDDVRSS